MKINKRLTNLREGTVIYGHNGGNDIILVSDYDDFHNWYEYHDFEITEDGEEIELNTGGYVTPSDLIGDEIF